VAAARASAADPHAAFGPEIEALYRADPHRPGSVDTILLDRMQPLTFESRQELYAPRAESSNYRAGTRPELERLVRAATSEAIHPVQVVTSLVRFCARIPRLFPTEQRPPSGGFWGDFSTYLCGGTEEEVIKKGSPLAAERARVLCVLTQVAGLPARIVFLARAEPAERHAVTEIFLQGRWSAFDGFGGGLHPWPKHGYPSVADIQRNPRMIDQAADHVHDRYTDSAYYRHAAIAEYDVMDWASYEYPWDVVHPEVATRLRAGLGG
jgi:hypothetical protein